MSTIILSVMILIIILFICFAIYVYINRESQTSQELFIKVLIAFVAAFFIIVFDIMKPLEVDKRKIQVLVLRNKEKTLTQEFANQLSRISSLFTGYHTIHELDLSAKRKNNFESKTIPYEIEDLDLVEIAFWCWLSKRYTSHWDIDINILEGISGGGGNISQREDAEKHPTSIKRDRIKNLLSHNGYELHPGNYFEINLPSGSKIKLIQFDEARRIYEISNKYYKLNIHIHYFGSSGVEHTILGNKIFESLKKFSHDHEYYTNNFSIELTCEYSKWYKGNPYFMRQKQWINELMDGVFINFDWSQIKPKLEKAYGIN